MFKRDQKVLCINNKGADGDLIINKIYTVGHVFKVNSSYNDELVKIRELGIIYIATRFVDATKFISEQEFITKFDRWLDDV